MTQHRNHAVALTFASAGASNMISGAITNPIDVVKVRMQVDSQAKGIYDRTYPGLLRGANKIVQTEGLTTLLTAGLLPSLLREGSYSTIRMGGYDPAKRLFSSADYGNAMPLYQKICAGALSGSAGSFFTTPFDLVKIRLQLDIEKKLPNTFILLYRTGKTEGVFKGLWRGVGPNVARATVTTAAQISSYDHSKHFMLDRGWFQEGPIAHFISSVVAGFAAATANNPVDVVKSRMQAENRVVGKSAKHRNIPQVIMLVLRNEGVGGLYKGWFPNWCRIAPHTCITFLVFEQLRRVLGIRPV